MHITSTGELYWRTWHKFEDRRIWTLSNGETSITGFKNRDDVLNFMKYYVSTKN